MNHQGRFAEALLKPEQACPPGLTVWNGSDPAHRFAVYRNNVIVSLIDALADTFAVTQELVGEAFFRAMARQFAYAKPPGSPLMAFYGEAFPDFVARFPPAAGVPYLADVARLEFMRVRAHYAADLPPVSPEEIAAMLADDEALPQLVLGIHPAVGILDSPAAVVSLWSAHQGNGNFARIIPDAPETALVLRDGLHVEVMTIPQAAGVFIEALRGGRMLSSALALAQGVDPDFDAALPLGLLVQKGAITVLSSGRKTP